MSDPGAFANRRPSATTALAMGTGELGALRPRNSATRRFRHRGEGARDRDVFRHLYTWADVFGVNPVGRQAFAPRQQQGQGQDQAPQACPDTSLVAVAQLAAFRFEARNCLVSLCCSKSEYVLADVSRTTLLQTGRCDDALNAGSWIGTSTFDRAQGLTGHALNEWQRARRPRDGPDQPDYYYTSQLSEHCYVVSDIRQGPHCKQTELIARTPWIRYYCSVPLRGGQGSVIGALTIVDDQPRYGISHRDLTAMEALSDTIVEQLHATVVRAQQQRSERMIQSMSLFNNGEGSMRNWWLSQDDAREHNKGRMHHAQSLRGVARSTSRSDRADVQFGRQKTPPQRPEMVSDVSSGNDSQSPAPVAATKSKQATLPKPRGFSDAKDSPPPEHLARHQRHGPEDVFDRATSISAAYDRAANLMREAMSVEGVVIINLDLAAGHMEHFPSSSEADDSTNSGEDAQGCDVYGSSVRNSAVHDGRVGFVNGFRIRPKQLQRIIRRYSQGVVLQLDPDGTFQNTSSDDSEHSGNNDDRERQHRRVKQDMQTLGLIVPSICSAALYPLWDNSNGQWRSCIFSWSTSMERILDANQDLSYMQSFGHSLMSELSRLEALAADYAKSTFISSISHELRSPLHGILAGAEFLHGTRLDTFQLEMTQTIDTAGKTLLDTIDHILEFSKISSNSRASRTEYQNDRRTKSVPGLSDKQEQMAAVDLAQLTENVVETCVFAYRSQMPSTPQGEAVSSGQSGFLATPSPQSPPSTASFSDVAITLNISQQPTWKTRLDSGAWTRILTNLVGNALKYTHSGHVSISLDAREPVRRINGITQPMGTTLVHLTVEDTGIGMSDVFRQSGAFMPFKQENPYSTGVGLGLSIVRSIARDMNATLNLDSKVGKGTRISLLVPIEFSQERPAAGLGETIASSEERPDVPGRPDVLQILAPQMIPGITQLDPTSDTTKAALQRSLLENAEAWLGCGISPVTNLDLPPTLTDASICAMTESALEVWKQQHPDLLATFLTRLQQSGARLLVVADSIRSVVPDPATTNPLLKQVFIHQPIGPAKLLRAIAFDEGSMVVSPIGNYSQSSSSRIGTPDQESPMPEVTARPTRPGLRRPTLGFRSHSKAQQDQGPTWGVVAVAGLGQTSEHGRLISPTSSTNVPRTLSSHSNRDLNDKPRDTVLLVEDNEVNMKLLVAVMNKLQNPFYAAVNGREAVDIYRRSAGSIFLVLMDMNMPVMDGFTATTKIREAEEKASFPRTYIIAVTGGTDDASKTRAFACGVNDFYSKPVRMLELKQVLEKVRQGLPAVEG